VQRERYAADASGQERGRGDTNQSQWKLYILVPFLKQIGVQVLPLNARYSLDLI